jgi:hypothetical protein
MEKIDYTEIWLTAQGYLSIFNPLHKTSRKFPKSIPKLKSYIFPSNYLQTINLLQQINLLFENPITLFIIWFPNHAYVAEVLLSLVALRDTEVVVQLLRGNHSAVAFVDQVLAGVRWERVWVVFENCLQNGEGD